MNRRAALKRIAAAGTVALGVTEITTSNAFADGGTVGRRPTNCAATISPTISTANSRLTISLATAATVCPGGGTPSIEWRYRSPTHTVRDNASPFTLLSTGNTWSAFTSITSIRITAVGSTTTLPNNVTVSIDIMTRRVCTNGTRRAWCCKQGSGSGTYSNVGGGSWGGTLVAVTPDTAGCDSPAP